MSLRALIERGLIPKPIVWIEDPVGQMIDEVVELDCIVYGDEVLDDD